MLEILEGPLGLENPAPGEEVRIGVSVRFFPPDSEDSDGSEEDVRFWEGEGTPGAQRVVERNLGAKQYIDDTTLVQAAALEGSVKHFTTATTVESLHLEELGVRLGKLVEKSEEIGMIINCKKTQLLLMSPANGCKTVACVPTPEGAVHTVDKLKLFGFMFGSSPDVSSHVRRLVDKFRVKVWLLFHLREAGIKEGRLFQLYCVYVRSVLEYCSPVYHSMLTRGQAESLERLQRHAGRICFGSRIPIKEVFQERGIPSLETRRVARVDKFNGKAVADARFGQRWFPRRLAPEHDLQDRRNFVEPQVRTMRLFNSPRNYFIRRANELGLS